jgi:hypothetical protein
MKSLFDNTARQEIRERLQKLTPDSSAQWGKFTCARVVAHFIDSMEIGFGERQVVENRGFLNSAFGRWLVTVAPMPVPKSAPTAPEYLVTQPGEFERDKQRVLDYLDRFAKGREQKWGVHPAFGNLSPEQWSRLHYRHFNHHLTQFGC